MFFRRRFSMVKKKVSGVKMVKKRLSDELDDLSRAKQQNFWQSRLLEMQLLLKEKKYSALSRRIGDLLECDRVTGRIKPPKPAARQEMDE
jgi:hypothetical protein